MNTADSVLEDTRKRIIHILSVYNKISPSMLQCGIGTSVSPKLWRPVLHDLIKEGVVLQEEEMRLSPSGRYNMYIILSLAKKDDPEPDPDITVTEDD